MDDPPPRPLWPLPVPRVSGSFQQDEVPCHMLNGKEAGLYMPEELPPEALYLGKRSEDSSPTPLAAPRGLKGLFNSDAHAAYQPLDLPSLPSSCVLLNVYDIGAELFQKINRVSTVNDTVLIGGVYHAGVEVYGVEWSYGFSEENDAGVCRCIPRTHPQHTYRATVNMGPTQLLSTEVEAALLRLADRWRGPDYSLIHHNCLDFCNAFCKELGVGRIPGWVDRFGRTASSIDNFSRRTADSIHRTKQLARTVSTDLDHRVRSVSHSLSQEMEQVVSGAKREVPRLAEASLESVQALSVGLARWSQGLLGAAARALGDDPAGRPGTGGEALRTSLRNRGGVRVAARGTRAAAAAVPGAAPTAMTAAVLPTTPATSRRSRQLVEEVVDPFLLDDLPVDDLPTAQEAASASAPDCMDPSASASNVAVGDTDDASQSPGEVAIVSDSTPLASTTLQAVPEPGSVSGSSDSSEVVAAASASATHAPDRVADEVLEEEEESAEEAAALPDPADRLASSWQFAGSAEAEDALDGTDAAKASRSAEVNVNVEEPAAAAASPSASDSEWQML